MRLVHAISGEKVDVSDDSATHWVKSSTPWMPYMEASESTVLEQGEHASNGQCHDGQKPHSALLEDILEWTQSLPCWLRDAARRLFEKESNLSRQDYEELYALMKMEAGVSEKEELTPLPLTKHHLPSTLNSEDVVVIKSMKELDNVNRISPQAKLDFIPNGMTIVFGGNGSGKSGYSRVLKKACRARDQSEPIHPDASDASSASKVPSAHFDIEVKGATKTLQWSRDNVSPDELSTITVFDTRCARSILTAEQEVAYLPYGLDVVENLANKVIPELKERLIDEIKCLDVDLSPFNYLRGATQVGTMFSQSGGETDPEFVKKLGTLSEGENNRLQELDKVLSSDDPLVKAEELRLAKERLKNLADEIGKGASWVSDAALKKLEKLTTEKREAEKAEAAAAEALSAGESLLPGTGAQLWKTLFEAAKRFAVEGGSKDSFPEQDGEQSCPLCQQTLTEDAKGRLIRFDNYVKAEVSLLAKQKTQDLASAVTKIQGATLKVKMLKSQSDEIRMLDEGLLNRISDFEASVEQRRASMLTAVQSYDWSNIPDLKSNPRSDIRLLASRQLKAARSYIKSSDPEARGKLEQERAELAARLELSKVLSTFLVKLENIKMKSTLEQCKNSLNTRPISAKSGELASKAVSEELKEALNRELKAFGIEHIGASLKNRTVQGQILQKMVLDIPNTRTKIEEVLSEGEQRAIALASFFAELSTANHLGGIVFDDPVSSLDHWRRINVAKRLVEEASKRQVIVFTHDTSFLGQLRTELDDTNTVHRFMYLERDQRAVGYVREGLPWGHQSYKERLTSLETEQRELAAQWSPYPNESQIRQLRQLYSELRSTVERIIQDVVFNGVVARYRDWVKVNMLKGVVGFEMGEHDDIERIYKRCCEVVESHDPSGDRGIALPTASDLKNDINDLRNVIKRITARRS
ncbi:hypothetical protein D515_03712 [Grimontia indica]|uniref:Protein CR006 P-loop domain-containing protein n=1 Tax=Grimontia indica TaxID=1056512 RepID=R1GN47_9GAMM|nr:AAA family ATPase [Grimontia indica]EOD77588.1 hypothetical protein D515_03712 [Grimontia indica]